MTHQQYNQSILEGFLTLLVFIGVIALAVVVISQVRSRSTCNHEKQFCYVCNKWHCPEFCPTCKGPCVSRQAKSSDNWQETAQQQVAAARSRAAEEYRAEQQQYQERARRESSAREQREAAEFRRWQNKFTCHVCNRLPAGPCVHTYVLGAGNRNGNGDRKEYTTHWDHPTDLRKCKKCGKWTCSFDNNTCSVNGMCKCCWGY